MPPRRRCAAAGGWDDHAAEGVIDRMLDEFDRPGRLEGRGFYEYADGKRTGSGRGLRDAFPPVADPAALSLRDLEERMLFIEALESVKCVDEGVIESIADANIGSIMGIGFPPWTGGVLQYINGYDGRPDRLRRSRARAGRQVRRPLRAAGRAGRARTARRALQRRAGRGHGLIRRFLSGGGRAWPPPGAAFA